MTAVYDPPDTDYDLVRLLVAQPTLTAAEARSLLGLPADADDDDDGDDETPGHPGW